MVLLLDDYLAADDFLGELATIAAPFRERVGIPGHPEELGLVCPDVEVAARYLQDNFEGMGPFFLAEGKPRVFIEHGEKRVYKTRVGFGFYKGIELELAEPGEGSELFAEHLDPEGRITIQHIGFFARGPRLRRGKCFRKKTNHDELMRAEGFEPWVEAHVVALGVAVVVRIFHTYEVADNVAIEYIDVRLFGPRGIKIPLPRRIMEFIARRQIKKGPRVFQLTA